MRLPLRSFLAGSAVLLAAATALAQAPQRTRGTIVSVVGDDIVIRTPSGQMTAHLGADTNVGAVKKASLDDIHPNSYVGTAAVPASNGKLRALEVTIFPEALRGTGEGSYPWDLGKSGSMTNGTVALRTSGNSMTNGTVGAMSGTNGRTIQVTYRGGAQTLQVPVNIPVVMLEPGNRGMLIAGAKVVVFGPVSGTNVEAKRIVVGEDGVRPPM